eukprot:15365482-Ditylum_brightwellii.AAC.1
MIMLTQSGLIDRIIEALGLEDTTGVESPSELMTIGKDLFGDKGDAVFNYLNFVGLWASGSPDDPDCARSRTGFVITLCNCPIIWASKLQKDQSNSTMEAEYVVLSTSLKDLFLFQCLVKELIGKFSLQAGAMNICSRVWEDNSGALILGNMEPGCFTPHTKHFGIKYHWFHGKLKPNDIKLLKVDTTLNKGNIFTKGLPAMVFKIEHKMLMGF